MSSMNIPINKGNDNYIIDTKTSYESK